MSSNGTIEDCSLDHFVRLQVSLHNRDDLEVEIYMVNNENLLKNNCVITEAVATKLTKAAVVASHE